jgi:hypothetical protein
MKLTDRLLKKMIEEELTKLTETDEVDAEAEEVEAGDEASTLEKKIDFIKALKIEEARLNKRKRKINEALLKLGARGRSRR